MSTLGIVLLIILVLILVGGLPNSPVGYNRGGGYGPSGILMVLLIIVIVLLATGRI